MSNNLQIAKSVTPTSHPTPYKQQLLFLSSIHHVLTKSHKLQQHCCSNFMSNISHLQQQSPHLHVQHLIHCKLPQLMSNSSQITKTVAPHSCPTPHKLQHFLNVWSHLLLCVEHLTTSTLSSSQQKKVIVKEHV